MNISKEQFVQIINALIAQEERDREIGKSLDNVVKDGFNHSLVFSTPLVEKVIETLDYDEIISWWFWDGPECGKNADKFAIYLGDADDPNIKRFAIHDAGELYDCLVEAQK